jgi:SAM-dependent methyltransferase
MNWDERYNNPGYVYGTEPNDFLVQQADLLPQGEILCLAEGEGRNAVYLAGRGWRVTAVDSSVVGLNKALALATSKCITLTAVLADLAAFDVGKERWDGIISCYCHLPPPLRRKVHRSAVAGLKPGGIFILEGFGKGQPAYGTGGPTDFDLLFALEDLKDELTGLEFIHATAKERIVIEGTGHSGLAAVVQLVARKPASRLRLFSLL